ncbi:mandelate racemase/muconate lactonizing enzyme family protein [Paenibacillus thalictri]|uniref:Mandelate racemase/muconate lactonizing enzyme family protein n=1 Tax=Paenibacillus thalictri TaxID=2527873 RepID=A0A4Q9DG25_9BACL|nr:mandelate racemase/muconate lactonizing enzyme family protein [Paenibacillus thalictri]TBL71057.1 mandelate racemase/muconate lactonizing enzyme family protein [Paenibacillus thalictri]
MMITAIHTITLDEFPNLIWVQLETSEGITGLGETYYGPQAVSGYIHETAAPYLLGRNPLTIDLHAQALDGYVGFNSISAEMRGASAIDIALWDIFGQRAGLPIYQLLGGRTHDKVKVYNTCAGYGYNRKKVSPEFNLHDGQNLSEKHGVGIAEAGPYEDLDAFHHRPGDLARSLLAEGITAMKIWPFDQFAGPFNGQWISPEDLAKGVAVIREIRDAVGSKMEIALEMHAKWSLPAAKAIAAAVDPYGPVWYEDPVKPDNLDTWLEFARSTRTPVAGSELLATRRQYLPLFVKRAVDFVIVDLVWCGGFSEAKKIATMAEAYRLPVMPHDCTGPVALAANAHFAVNAPNCFTAEFVRAYYSSWYRDLATALPVIENGYLVPTETPGLGIKLHPVIETYPGYKKRSSFLT